MPRKFCFLLTVFFLVSNTLHSRESLSHVNIQKKSIKAVRTNEKISIDGNLSEKAWKNVPIATDFLQLDPDNGKPASYKTEVKFLYDNTSLYIGAMLYDPQPEKINKNLSKRDDLENNDFFLIVLDPFNNGLDGVEFIVSPANVQLDAKVTQWEDFSWNAVWSSAVKITEDGWRVEIEIPYSALRFSNLKEQKWGLNIIRNIQRDNEKVTWNFIDKNVRGYINQSGELTGLKDLKPPFRLSFVPFTSFYLIKDTDNKWDTQFKGGMDMKLGISKSFTLDMILIPDFEQVQSDDQVLNLSPYEIKFNENRQFFTEGTEIFSRGNVFYSRRIGHIPRRYYEVEDELKENEKIEENPVKTKILNATKLSGRDSKGLGVGFLNAITTKSVAKIIDTITGVSRDMTTQSFTNYNLLFVDKSMKNESYISFFNSNLASPNDDYAANVTGTDFFIKDKPKKYGYIGKAILSQRFPNENEKDIGFRYDLEFQKLKGEYRYGFIHQLVSDKYNPNDLGFLNKNNFVDNVAWFAYNMPNPNEKYNSKNINFTLVNEYLYNPFRYAEFSLNMRANYTLKSQRRFGFWSSINPFKTVDYLEARVEGMKYNIPARIEVGGWYGTDYRKDFSTRVYYEYEKTFSRDKQQRQSVWLNFTYRFSDKFTLRHHFSIFHSKIFGYVNDETINNKSVVYFGRRENLAFNNIISGDYILSSNGYFSLRARHYISDVKYSRFYTLNDDGNLENSDYLQNHNQNYNAFSIDGAFTWRFAPGSDMSIVWKNSLYASEEHSNPDFFSNLKNVLDMNKTNSFSIRLIYYLDYIKLRRKT